MTALFLRPVTATLHIRLLVPLDALTRALRNLPLREIAVGASIMFAASTMVYADEHIQDWIPDVIEIPEDAEVVTDHAIGSSARFFSTSTGADVDALLADWEESLSQNGYPIKQGELPERSIEFSGPGIVNAKIIVAPTVEDGRNIIEFDATLD